MINLNSESKPHSGSITRDTPIAKQSTRAELSSDIDVKASKDLPVQWAKVSNITELNGQQKAQLVDINPSLSKTLSVQIKGETRGESNVLSARDINQLKQTPLHLLRLELNNQSIRIVTANTLVKQWSVNQPIPLIAAQYGWTIANEQQVNSSLQDTAAQLLKQNLPTQTSMLPLLKIATLVRQSGMTVLEHLPDTRAKLAILDQQVVDTLKLKSPTLLKQTLSEHMYPKFMLGQLNQIQHAFLQETTQAVGTALHPQKVISALSHSLTQLQQVLSTPLTNRALTLTQTINHLQSQLQAFTNLKQEMSISDVKIIDNIQHAISRLIANIHNTHPKEDLPFLVHQQVNHLQQSLSHLVNSPANQALLQLLGIALYGQKQDQHQIQSKIQQQLKQLIENTTAKLQINQLRHLGLDSTREPTPSVAQQHYGEFALRFNEQLLPLTYQIQGFTDNESEYETDNKHESNREKTRRWQIFMSLDLPQNETLHCKMTLINETIDTTLWAESHKLCQTTTKALTDLRERLTNAGLNVKQLQCFEGLPPQDETSLSYHLVDVTT